MNEGAPGSRSAGALLRAAREKQGLHIAALAAAIKVSQRKLEALEADRVDELPDATFTRALAQTVCRTLKIDARPVLDLLPPAPSVALEPHSGGLNAPFRDRPGREDPGIAGGALRPLLGASVLLVVGAAVLYFTPAGLWQSLTRQAPAPVVIGEPPPVAVAASAPAMALPPMAPASEPAAAPVFAVAPSPEPVASAPVTALPAAVPAPTPAVAAASASAPDVPGLVQLRPSAASWVEARDAGGRVLLFRTVLPGESVGLNGNLPIRLTIGNASAMQLGFRGQPVDLTARTRDNVARLELQ